MRMTMFATQVGAAAAGDPESRYGYKVAMKSELQKYRFGMLGGKRKW